MKETVDKFLDYEKTQQKSEQLKDELVAGSGLMLRNGLPGQWGIGHFMGQCKQKYCAPPRWEPPRFPHYPPSKE